ncbi:tetraspanin-9 [Anastrepha obliqua]|uniref:tetraspanin-9 n=1 Tax=Anastrepha ludens TaxID=28586 RepID=UPI0023AE8DCB|nr:tetraspanin-9 [Anastrepha ludens]XP_053950334.1 tetraspanin-9 [Anastrepha ludens]XP_053950335.1 tetraspanin-9 [Anastrepha ludens]XP_054730622.1 tetraspanin-9 [Anastrepha obliqua]XP_054730623.1 tetraspanin-9 [Anastrepha obliqua]XP_054730626.1 tetraspanin-9 [Anastrepha obliqua]XP_054730627.1 tetraspanin-9 [Anastrepha obliqua]XP_054730628.1 tetraspanin-9 [Anastrepha obliqua]
MGNAGYTCIRRTFCWLNIILWLCSCAFLGAGVWLRLSYEGYATLLPDHHALSADSIFLAIGVVGFVISFFGCCGAWVQSRCLLVLYFLLIVMLFLSEFLIGSIAFLFRGGLGRTFANELRFGIERHYNASDRGSLVAPSVAAIWDNVQQSFECCGVSSYEDWYDIQSWSGKRWVPESCCRPSEARSILTEGSGDSFLRVECGKSENPALWWSKGCAHSLQAWFQGQLNVIGAVGLGIAFAQLFGLITSMLLFCTVKHKRETETYKSYSPSIDPQTRTNMWED